MKGNTTYGNMTIPERYTLTAYHVLVFLSSIIGDVIILVTSIKYGAFKLHQVIVTLIQHIAISDLIMSVVIILPRILILIVNKPSWVDSGPTCIEYGLFVIIYLYAVCMYLVSALTVSKLVIFKCPLKAKNWTQKEANLVGIAVWLGCLLIPTSISLVQTKDVEITNADYECNFSNKTEVPALYFLFTTGLGTLMPCVIIVFATIPTLMILLDGRKVSRRSGGEVRWQGVATVLMTAVVFLVANLPYVTWVYYVQFKSKNPSVHFTRVAASMPPLNIMSNFYIYCLTVPSFRRFLLSKTKLAFGKVSGSTNWTDDSQSQVGCRKKVILEGGNKTSTV